MNNDLCKICGKPSVFVQKAANFPFCKDHFIRYVEKKIQKAISKYDMISEDDKIAVGVSGGKDSLVMLLNLFYRQKKVYKSKPLTIIMVNEGISDIFERNKQNLLDFLDHFKIDSKLIIIDIKNIIGKNMDEIVPIMKERHISYNACTICATIRRKILNDTARDAGATKLAIGHNLDDLGQTLLQNILRNDLAKISKNPPHMSISTSFSSSNAFIPRIKPLLNLTENEIVEYCHHKGIKHVKEPCPYSTKFPIFRRRIMNFLNEFDEKNNEVKYNLLDVNYKLYEVLRNKNDNKKHIIGKTCKICGDPCGPQREICMYCEILDLIK